MAASQGSMIDRIYRSLLLSKYFTKGWGSPQDIKSLLEFRKVVCRRSECVRLVPEQYPVEIVKDQTRGGIRVLEGKFHSPFDLYLPELMPKETKLAHFQMILPSKWKEEKYRPVCIHMAATGDHFYWRRRTLMAKPLLEEAGIASILLQNPFYGDRKPAEQTRSILNNVLDIFTMGGCLMMEGMVLHNWCKKVGLGPVGFTGYSMGGHMASLAATGIPEPVVLVPCLSWTTASGVFTEGVMSKAIDWKLLLAQYRQDESFQSDIKNMVHSLSQDAFKAGKSWIKSFDKGAPRLELEGQSANNILVDMKKSEAKDPPSKKNGDIRKFQEEVKLVAESPEKSDPVGYEERFALLKRLNNFALPGKSGDRKVLKKAVDLTNRQEELKLTVDFLAKSGLVSHREWYSLLKGLSHFILPGINAPVDWEQHEAFHFMKGIMDECTHLANFSLPVDTSLIIAVCAEDDEYVPRNGVSHIKDIWPAAEVRYVEGGHVWAFVLHQRAFRKAVKDAFALYKEKYLPEMIPKVEDSQVTRRTSQRNERFEQP